MPSSPPLHRFYLDANATTPLCPRARAAMEPYLDGLLGNPSSLHAEGRRARAAVDDSRARVAAWLGCREHEIIFTGGGTESNNLGFMGLALAQAERGRQRHVVTCAAEHHCVLHAADALCRRHHFEVTRIGVDADGLLDLAAFERALRPGKTAAVSIMSANNETGVRSPMIEVGAACVCAGVPLHIDAVQSAGKETLDLAAWQPSALSLAAHKFGGPHGAGLLFVRSGQPIARLFEGGSHENERRPGTENVAAIVGMAAAGDDAERRWPSAMPRLFSWIEDLWRRLDLLGGIRRNGHPSYRIANTLNVSFDRLDGEELLIGLDLEGLAVSTGSACLVGSVQTSHVLRAMGRREDEARATIRVSVGSDISEADLGPIAQRFSKVIARQRAVRNQTRTSKAA
jgi:cysteine desulfurase